MTEDNISYFMIGGALFSATFTVFLWMVFSELFNRRRVQERAFIEQATRKNLARSSNAMRRGHRR